MAHKTFSAPEAYILIDGSPVGYIRNVKFSENINRADVQGLGSLTSIELPPTKIQCSFNAGFFFIDFTTDLMKKILNRFTDRDTFLNSVALGDFPMQIAIYKKTIQTQDASTKLVTKINKDGQKIAFIDEFYIESQDFDLSEGGVAGTNISGRYLNPVVIQ